ncbi:hypothetical protein SAMN05444161_5311 [Rhizobiales bacterium GAS191]|nr:hypothetical protein SAMN05444161_5311 [Rhizobiales bacterium GAS191]
MEEKAEGGRDLDTWEKSASQRHRHRPRGSSASGVGCANVTRFLASSNALLPLFYFDMTLLLVAVPFDIKTLGAKKGSDSRQS